MRGLTGWIGLIFFSFSMAGHMQVFSPTASLGRHALITLIHLAVLFAPRQRAQRGCYVNVWQRLSNRDGHGASCRRSLRHNNGKTHEKGDTSDLLKMRWSVGKHDKTSRRQWPIASSAVEISILARRALAKGTWGWEHLMLKDLLNIEWCAALFLWPFCFPCCFQKTIP